MGISDGKQSPLSSYLEFFPLLLLLQYQGEMSLKQSCWPRRRKEGNLKYTSGKGAQSCWIQMPPAQIHLCLCICNSHHLWFLTSLCFPPIPNSPILIQRNSSRLLSSTIYVVLNQFNTRRLNNRTQGKKNSLITYSAWGVCHDFKIKGK